MKIEIDGYAKLSRALRGATDALEGEGRRELHAAMGTEVQMLTVRHLQQIAQTRHATAERLGASPSGHFAAAAEKVESPSALSADSGSATLTIDHVGLARTFRDVTITPKTGKALAIPINALAYNRWPRQFEPGTLFVLGGKKNDVGRNILAMRDPSGGAPIAMYLLVRSVTQKQDRTLLPSNDEWEAAAAEGARGYVRQVREQQLLA